MRTASFGEGPQMPPSLVQRALRTKSSGTGQADAYAVLGAHLKQQRQLARLSLRAVAARLEGRPGCSAASLCRAEQGRSLVRWETVAGFLTACGADVGAARKLWFEASLTTKKQSRPVRGGTCVTRPGLDPRLVGTPAALIEGMRLLRINRGSPTLRTLERRARRELGCRLARSTLSDVLRGSHLPSEAFFRTYLLALGLSPLEAQPWLSAWSRVHMMSGGADRPRLAPGAADLLHQARQGIRKARTGTPNERFATAHLAALRTAAAILATRSRPEPTRMRARIRSAWEVLPDVAPELSSWAELFGAQAERRARAEAGIPGAVSSQDAQDMVRDAGMFLRLVERMLVLPTRANLADRTA